VAEVYGADVRQAIHRAMALAEPVMIVVMGLVVGLIVFSMLSAVFSINELPM
jgi:type II secretory pathway component PulF